MLGAAWLLPTAVRRRRPTRKAPALFLLRDLPRQPCPRRRGGPSPCGADEDAAGVSPPPSSRRRLLPLAVVPAFQPQLLLPHLVCPGRPGCPPDRGSMSSRRDWTNPPACSRAHRDARMYPARSPAPQEASPPQQVLAQHPPRERLLDAAAASGLHVSAGQAVPPAAKFVSAAGPCPRR